MADETYCTFLSLLSESQLFAHINTLSQVSQREGQHTQENSPVSENGRGCLSDIQATASGVPLFSGPKLGADDPGVFAGTSTPVAPKTLRTVCLERRFDRPLARQASSLASDPFDDGLDSQLLRLATGTCGEAPAFALDSMSSLGSESTPIPANQLAFLRMRSSFEGIPQHLPRKRPWSLDEAPTEKYLDGLDGVSLRGENNHSHGSFPNASCGRNQPLRSSMTVAPSSRNVDLGAASSPLPENLAGPDAFASGTPKLPSKNASARSLQNISRAQSPAAKQNVSSGIELDDLMTSVFAEVGPQHGFGDYDTYFQNKYRKQQVADRDFIRWEKQRRVANGQSAEIPRIFAGCKIFVNGNTTPTLATIHKLVILHGGTFLSHLLNKGAATHIVCDRLTPRKRIQYRNYRVVKAQWVADCVSQEKLLDWKAYRLIDDIAPLQKRLGFPKIAGSLEEAWCLDAEPDIADKNNLGASDVHCTGVPELDISELCDPDPDISGEFPEKPVSDEAQNLDSGYCLQHKHQSDGESPSENPRVQKISHDETNPFLDQDYCSTTEQSESEQGGSAQALPLSEKTSVSKISAFSQFKVSKPRQAFAQMDARHPDFLKHFFANSRLHHLSTWKADLKSKFLRLVARESERPKRPPMALPVILHIDFDCFFATASALKHSDLNIKRDPIAVSHGGKSSDIASCNYVARNFGVSNGMWLGRALELCPNLKVIDYDFESYEKFSHAFYSYLISKKVFDSIFPVLIDEVLVDATSHCHGGALVEKVDALCIEIRRDIFSLTGCTVSVGASLNVLLAKLAIRTAKPDGHFYLHQNIQEFLDKTDVQHLPGVGRSLAKRLSEEVQYFDAAPLPIREVRKLSSQRLAKVFGEKTGLRIFENCHGRDQTSIHLDSSSTEGLLGRKTVSVDVNYGIRFNLFSEAENFLVNLAKELHSRLIDLGACGSSITLRLAKRAPDAPVITPKFMGLGKCIFVSRSSSLGVATNDWGILGSEMKALFRTFSIPPQDLRGIAVSLSKLEDTETVKKQRQQKLVFTRKLVAQQTLTPVEMSQNFPFAEKVTGIESVDWEVFNQLPEEIKRELKKELLKRGIPVSGKERSPAKKDCDGSTKVYLQQMFPTQPYGEFKVKRIIESPTKKKKLESPKKATDQLKRDSPVRAAFNETVSYDEDVLNEIPSSIRKEFLEELEWQKKNKQMGFVSMKTRIERKQEHEKKIREQVIDGEWLRAQKRAVVFQNFNGNISNYHELIKQLRQWVRLTAEEEGPHPEDVAMFEAHLESVFQQGGIARVLNLIKAMTKELDKQENISRLCSLSLQQRDAMIAGIDDWRRHMTRIEKKFSRACAKIGISI